MKALDSLPVKVDEELVILTGFFLCQTTFQRNVAQSREMWPEMWPIML